MSFFSLNTPLMNKIDAATSENLIEEDWGLNMEICDMMYTEENGEANAAKQIKKRLQNRNPRIVILTLTVLETCVKNARPPPAGTFLYEISSPDFMHLLESKIESRSANNRNTEEETPAPVKEKIMALMAQWKGCSAFNADVNLQGFSTAYDNLKALGYDMPAPVVDDVPLVTPAAHHYGNSNNNSNGPGNDSATMYQGGYIVNNNNGGNYNQQQQQEVPFERITPLPEQVEKLKGEIAVVRTNLGMFMEALSQPEPEMDIVEPIHVTLREMHRRILFLVEEIQHEELMGILLQSVDSLNVAFERYQKVMTRINNSRSTAHVQQTTANGNSNFSAAYAGAAASNTINAGAADNNVSNYSSHHEQHDVEAVEVSLDQPAQEGGSALIDLGNYDMNGTTSSDRVTSQGELHSAAIAGNSASSAFSPAASGSSTRDGTAETTSAIERDLAGLDFGSPSVAAESTAGYSSKNSNTNPSSNNATGSAPSTGNAADDFEQFLSSRGLSDDAGSSAAIPPLAEPVYDNVAPTTAADTFSDPSTLNNQAATGKGNRGKRMVDRRDSGDDGMLGLN
eukprot:Nk52_evm24s212 gene=Nk52_evmTU24s212